MFLKIVLKRGQATFAQAWPVQGKRYATWNTRHGGQQLSGAPLQAARVIFERQVENITLGDGLCAESYAASCDRQRGGERQPAFPQLGLASQQRQPFW